MWTRFMLLSMLAAAATGASGAYVFEDSTYLGDATEWGAWADMLQRYAPEHAVLRACREHEGSCPKRHKGLHIILQRGADLELHKKLQLVNRYVNRKGYRVDRHTRVEAHRSSKQHRNKDSNKHRNNSNNHKEIIETVASQVFNKRHNKPSVAGSHHNRQHHHNTNKTMLHLFRRV